MFISLCVVCFVVIVSTVYLLLKRHENNKYLKDIPGPKPNLYLGNLDKVIFVPKEKYLDIFFELINKYGRLIKFFAGPNKLIILSADAAFNEYLMTSTKIIDKSEFYGFLHAWLGTGLLTSTGQKWKNRRRILTPTFHFSILENYVEVFESVGNTFIEKLEKYIHESSVDIFPLVTLCTLDVICETAMGTKLNALNNESTDYIASVKTMCAIFIERVKSPLHPLLYFLTPNYYREKKALKILHSYTDKIVNQKIQEMSMIDETSVETSGKKKRLAFLDLLLKITVDGESLSKTDIREEVDTFMFEGHDTTATAISFALYSLSTNPEVQEKAYQEQKNLFKTELKSVKPTMSQLQEMKYLEKVIKETLRLYPSVPSLARKTPSEEITWNGHTFPKNMEILVSIFATHRDPKYFPDPLKFNPDRFNEESRINTFVYTPFSAGPRNCIGQKFAMLEMKSIISKVLRNYQLLPSNPYHEIKLIPNVVLTSANGICIAFQKRIDT